MLSSCFCLFAGLVFLLIIIFLPLLLLYALLAYTQRLCNARLRLFTAQNGKMMPTLAPI